MAVQSTQSKTRMQYRSETVSGNTKYKIWTLQDQDIVKLRQGNTVLFQWHYRQNTLFFLFGEKKIKFIFNSEKNFQIQCFFLQIKLTWSWRSTAAMIIVLVAWLGTLKPVLSPCSIPTSTYLMNMNPLDLMIPNTTGYSNNPGLSAFIVSRPDNTSPEQNTY